MVCKFIRNVFIKGNVFWYNNNMKLLLNSGIPKKAYKSMVLDASKSM